MKKLLFAIGLMAMLLVLPCCNGGSKYKNGSGSNQETMEVYELDSDSEAEFMLESEPDSEPEFMLESEPEDDSILTPGVTYVTASSSSDTDILGGKVNLTMEFTIYQDGSAVGNLIETNSTDSYGNTDSFNHPVEGTWEELFKHDKRFLAITLSLKSDDYYNEFVYYIDKDLNAYAEDINTTPVKLVKKTETKLVSTPSVQDIPFIPMVVKSNPLTFTYSSFVNSNKTYPVSGIWCPAEVEKHSIMCISNGQQDPYRKYFYIFNKEQSDIWTNSFTGLKELFISYENIAKENGVTTDIQKEVTDKFEFAGQYGSQTIVKEYNWENDETVQIRPIYLFKNNVSSIEVYVEDFYLHKVSLLWTFRSVQDFDELINAINWERFMAKKTEQVQTYTAEQNALKAAVDKAQKERELFN